MEEGLLGILALALVLVIAAGVLYNLLKTCFGDEFKVGTDEVVKK